MTTENEVIDITKTRDKLTYHLTKSKVFDDMARTINREIPLTIFPRAAREKISINQWVKTVEDAKKQQTVVSTVRLSYEGVKTYFSYEANEFFEKYKDAKIKVLSYGEVIECVEFDGLAFDVVFEIDGEKIAIEIKVTQGKKGFMGTTHSTSKVNDYLFIALKVDRDSVVEVGKNYVQGMMVAIESHTIDEWIGVPSEKNSITSLKLKDGKHFICGGVGKGGHFIYEDITYE